VDVGNITQGKLSEIIDIPLHKIRYAETGAQKISQEIAEAVSEKLDYNLTWILTGEGPMKRNDILRETADSYSIQPRHPAAVLMPSPDNTGPPGINPSIQAMSDIKEIFDSGDPILIPAIQANLNAFKRALLREHQFAQVIQENKELKERIAKLEKIIERIPELEVKIERLQTENDTLKEKINTLAGRHGGCPPTALEMEHAARTGTDDQVT